MKIYVAGASNRNEHDRVRAALALVRDAGHEVTLDWLAAMEAEPTPDQELPRPDAARYARADLLAAREADVFWLLAPRMPTRGAWVELGYALAARASGVGPQLIVVSGPYAQSIFCACADIETATDPYAWGKIQEWIDRRVGDGSTSEANRSEQ